MAEPGANSGLEGAPLLGMRTRSQQLPPNTFRPWQYLLILFVLVIGAIYSAPNLFQPDPAIQIKPRNEQVLVNDTLLTGLSQQLMEENIGISSNHNKLLRKEGNSWFSEFLFLFKQHY